MTRKLFDENAYLKEFTAKIIDTKIINSELSKIKSQDSVIENNAINNVQIIEVVLDATAFFPTQGGQTCDKGTIAGFEVVDIKIKDGI